MCRHSEHHSSLLLVLRAASDPRPAERTRIVGVEGGEEATRPCVSDLPSHLEQTETCVTNVRRCDHVHLFLLEYDISVERGLGLHTSTDEIPGEPIGVTGVLLLLPAPMVHVLVSGASEWVLEQQASVAACSGGSAHSSEG